VWTGVPVADVSSSIPIGELCPDEAALLAAAMRPLGA